MKIERLPYNPQSTLEFYEQGLSALGALCERTWHDRLAVLAEDRAAMLWKENGTLHSVELQFVSVDAKEARDATCEVFPGCPLTFRLAETLIAPPLTVERVVLDTDGRETPPATSVVEKIWRTQFPATRRWRLAAPFKPDFHLSIFALARCEIQAIDQNWSLHRLAFALSDGTADAHLAQEIDYSRVLAKRPDGLRWPKLIPQDWRESLRAALMGDLESTLGTVRDRQQKSLARELERIDEYFDGYCREVETRGARSQAGAAKIKTSGRVAAAKAEHARRRNDQVARHEIRVIPHLDALLLIAEPAWSAPIETEVERKLQVEHFLFTPRCRRWFLQR